LVPWPGRRPRHGPDPHRSALTRRPSPRQPRAFLGRKPCPRQLLRRPRPKGQTPHVSYKEGVFLGYRYYTSSDKKPLFPFGFGLSYTTFSFSNLKVSPEQASPDASGTVSFDVSNTGQLEGATVAQVYVGDPSAKVRRPVKELKGFEKVRLGPGDTHHVNVILDRRSLAYWSEDKNGWQVDPGKFVIFVGDSSENTPLTQELQVQ
jgi:beta-glucosidase